MNSFTWRLTLRFATLVTITTATVLAVGGWMLDRQMRRRLELLHEVEFKEVQGIFRGEDALTPEELTARMRAEAESDTALYYFQMRNAAKSVLFRSPNLGNALLPESSGNKMHGRATVPEIGPLLISQFQAGGWQVQIGSALAPSQQLLRDYVRVAGGLVLSVTIAGVGLGYGFSRYTLRPLRAIEQTAQRIRGDNLGERIAQPEGADELADLVRLLNRMFDRLESSFAQVRRFTADASHELKTPLALVRLNAEKLRARVGNDPETTEIADEINEDLESLRQITESLLFLAKAESGTFAPARAEVRAESFVRDLEEDAKAMAEEVGVVFSVERNDAGVVRCEPTLVRQMALNLLTNALRVVPQGGRITLRSEVRDGTWNLEIMDEGPGLPAAQLERIFERFVRFGPTESGPGHGLGLAICRSIAGLHGGKIAAANRKDRPGLRVSVELPNSRELL